MTRDVTNTQQDERVPPKWVQALGWIGGLLAFTFLVLFALASCTAHPKADGRVTVIDTADLLSPSAELDLHQIRFPEDIPVIVRTVGAVPIKEIGVYATKLMEDDPYWQRLRPRGFLRRVVRQDVPSGSGIYVLASQTPRLVQIRFGRNIRMSAYQAGLAAGTWYRARQEFGSDQQLVATVRDLAAKMSGIVDPWWLLAWAQYVSSMAVSEVEDFLAPSDGLYSNWVLGGYIRLADFAGATASLWTFVAFNVLCFVVLWLVGKKLVIEAFLLPRIEAGWARFILLAVSNLGLLGFLLTGFAALALLSKGRIEDELALGALGLSFLSVASFDPVLFSTNGGLWLAIPGMMISFVAEVLESKAASVEAQRRGEQLTTLTFGWLIWGCALYLLPMAVGIPALIVLLWSSGTKVVASSSAS